MPTEKTDRDKEATLPVFPHVIPAMVWGVPVFVMFGYVYGITLEQATWSLCMITKPSALLASFFSLADQGLSGTIACLMGGFAIRCVLTTVGINLQSIDRFLFKGIKDTWSKYWDRRNKKIEELRQEQKELEREQRKEDRREQRAKAKKLADRTYDHPRLPVVDLPAGTLPPVVTSRNGPDPLAVILSEIHAEIREKAKAESKARAKAKADSKSVVAATAQAATVVPLQEKEADEHWDLKHWLTRETRDSNFILGWRRPGLLASNLLEDQQQIRGDEGPRLLIVSHDPAGAHVRDSMRGRCLLILQDGGRLIIEDKAVLDPPGWLTAELLDNVLHSTFDQAREKLVAAVDLWVAFGSTAIGSRVEVMQ